VYVPTNHLYLGDVVVYPRSSVFFPDVTVEEGIRIFLTGGMSFPDVIRGKGNEPAARTLEPREGQLARERAAKQEE
jgi:hypothetical protein